MRNTTEKALVNIIRCDPGSPDAAAALAELWERHAGFVAKMLAKYDVPSDEIDDLVSEAFWWAYKKMSGKAYFSPTSTDPDRIRQGFVVWVSTIGKNLYRDKKRKADKLAKLREPVDVALIHVASKKSTNDSQKIRCVQTVMAKCLSEDDRNVLREYMKLDMPDYRSPEAVTETSQKLGRSKDAVRKANERVRKRLKKFFQSNGCPVLEEANEDSSAQVSLCKYQCLDGGETGVSR